MCASTQPLATDIGLDIIKAGGNAMDAAVAMAAALNGAGNIAHFSSKLQEHSRGFPAVTEPTSTGIGGDCFCLYFDATTGQVSWSPVSFCACMQRLPTSHRFTG